MSRKLSLKIVLHIENVRTSPPLESSKKKQKVVKGDRDDNVLDKAMREVEQQRVELARKQEEERLKQIEVKKQEEEREQEYQMNLKRNQEAEAMVKTFQLVASVFENERYPQIMAKTLSLEKEIPREHNEVKWQKICHHFYTCFKDHSKVTSEEIGHDPEVFYQEILKNHVANLFVKQVGVLHKRGIFERFSSLTHPICFVSMQKKFDADIFPRLDCITPLSQLEEYGLIMPDLRTFNPLSSIEAYKDLTPMCYGLFHSYSHRFNLATAFFMDSIGRVGYRWAIFDRFQNEFGTLNLIN